MIGEVGEGKTKEEGSMKRTLILIAVLVVAASAVTFAAGKNESAAAGKKVSLEYWIAGDPIRTPVYQKSIDAFVAKNPNISVTINEEVGTDQQI